jgi:signal transduction histidine kinase
MSKPLLQRNTRYLLTWLPVVLLFCSFLFYVMLRMQAHHMQEKQLLLKQENVWKTFVANKGNIEKHIIGEYDIVEATQPVALNASRDTLVYYADEKKSLPFEILTGRMQWNNTSYNLTTYVSSTEISHLIIKVFITEAFILLLLLVAIVILNRKSSKLLWKPFFSTLHAANNYDIARNQPLALATHTGTTEFDELNGSMISFVNNANTAYFNQKQFVENASHEMQTPLAIIRSKLELLINQPGLTEKSASMLQDITEANDHLSQMNRNLLLLSKIENNQFPDAGPVDVSQMLRHLLNSFQEHYEYFPALTCNIEDHVVLQANRSLIEILLSNLVNNAIIHNKENGEMNVTLSSSYLLIQNTGPKPDIDPMKLFERFKKGSYQTKTTGLGLSLVKQIVLLYQYQISYQYLDGWHMIKVTFR